MAGPTVFNPDNNIFGFRVCGLEIVPTSKVVSIWTLGKQTSTVLLVILWDLHCLIQWFSQFRIIEYSMSFPSIATTIVRKSDSKLNVLEWDGGINIYPVICLLPPPWLTMRRVLHYHRPGVFKSTVTLDASSSEEYILHQVLCSYIRASQHHLRDRVEAA